MGEEVGRALVARGLVTEEQLESARAEAAGNGVPPWRVLLQRGLVTETDIDEVAAATMGSVQSLAPPATPVAPAPAAPPVAPLPPPPAPNGARAANGNGAHGATPPKLGALPPVAVAPPPGRPAAAAPAPVAGIPSPVAGLSAPAPAAPAEAEVEDKDPNLAEFLEAVIDGSGSDLHLTAGLPPMVRVHGELRPIRGFRRLKPVDLQELIYSFLTQKQRETFEEHLELDVSYSLPGRARFRVNVFK